MLDEFPRMAYLTGPEVRRLLRIENHKEWSAFLTDNPTFPRQVPVGKTRGGKPRLRYPKHKIYAWMELNLNP
jgi:hypothetical protein